MQQQKFQISRPSAQAASRQFTSDSTDNKSGKVYELRKYVFKPDSVAEFNKLNEMFYLRTNFSKLIGYWSCEMGSQLNSYVHIWEYDNLQHRASVRKELSQNEEWIGKYFTNLCTMMISQENSTMYMPFWCDTVNSSPKQNGIYELMTYTMVMGGPVIWGKQLRATVESHKRLGYSDLVGVWYTDIGDHNTVHVLWRHDSYDSRRIGREKAHGDAVVINKVRDNFRNVTKHSSVIMLPTPWSTIQ
uniref:NIPSNAP domain-containing protein n=1 Tax=Ciona savignyi TaxID=51511 RepID=H2YX53_CIOSA